MTAAMNAVGSPLDYPATLRVETPEKMANWRPLVQWILAIPHLLIAGALEYVSGALAIVSWFVILFTGRLPKDLADFQIMILRYTTRAELYSGFLYEEYPPFDFTMSPGDPGGSPVEVNVTPELENRNRLTVGLRFLWFIPALVYTLLIWVVAAFCWLFAFFAILFTGRWPDGLRNWVMKFNRVSIRLEAYMLLLTDEYPPFATD
ncbi:MAG: DUF4389 domain-containing protein [Acidimicrobiia bacterium]|nr:DUF4389 domain-containing protein [Acidimicrobiia bacterium]